MPLSPVLESLSPPAFFLKRLLGFCFIFFFASHYVTLPLYTNHGIIIYYAYNAISWEDIKSPSSARAAADLSPTATVKVKLEAIEAQNRPMDSDRSQLYLLKTFLCQPFSRITGARDR